VHGSERPTLRLPGSERVTMRTVFIMVLVLIVAGLGYCFAIGMLAR
jgi:hypothetical protein